MEKQTEVEATGLVHDEELDTRRKAPPTEEPLPPKPTPQDFSSLLFMMQKQYRARI